MGLLVKKTDALWNITEYEYDAHGKLTTVTYPDESQRSFSYNTHGQRTSEVGVEGTTLFEYDILGRLEREEKPSGQVTELTYDHMGRVLTSDTGTAQTPYTYDSYGNVLTTSTTTGNDKSNTYDGNMRLSDATDEFGSKSYAYDNVKDRLTSVTDEELNTTTYSYDSASRLNSELSDSGRQKHFTYDEYGRRSIAGAGVGGASEPIEHSYDYAGRLESTSYTNGSVLSTVGMKYDEKGRTTQITDWVDPTNGLRYRYDILGRVDQIRDHYGATLQYAYDEMSRVVHLKDYFGVEIEYEYDPIHGHVSRIEAGIGEVWEFDYDTSGDLASYTSPNGMTTTYKRDNDGRVEEIRLTNRVAIVERISYTYNSAGMVASETKLDGAGWTYLYDDRGRLTVATRFGAGGGLVSTFAYTYDGADNLTSQVIGDINGQLDTQAFTYFEDNVLASVTSNGGTPVAYTYDDWGRVQSKTDGTHTATYGYTEGIEPTELATDFPGAEEITFSHRGDAKRRRQDVPDEISFFQWGLGDYPVSMEVLPNATALKSLSSGSIRRTFVPLDPLAPSTTVLGHVGSGSSSDGSSAYYFHDINGSVRRAFDSSASGTGTVDYSPFGQVVATTGAHPPLGYNGALYEPRTGDHYQPSGLRAMAPMASPESNLNLKTHKHAAGELAIEMESPDLRTLEQVCAESYGECLRCDEIIPGGVERSPWEPILGRCGDEVCIAVGRTCEGIRERFSRLHFLDCAFPYRRCMEEARRQVLEEVPERTYVPHFIVQQGNKIGENPDTYRVRVQDRTFTGGQAGDYTWRVDGVVSGENAATTSFDLGLGTYTIEMTLTLDWGGPISNDETVLVLEKEIDVVSPPDAAFSVVTDLSMVTFPATVEFDNDTTNTGSVYLYRWNFGDGTSEEIANPSSTGTSHTYARPGNYTVTLAALGSAGSDVASQQVEFVVDPVPNFTWSQDGYSGAVIMRDTTLVGSRPIEVREWDFDGDATFDDTNFSTNSVVSHTFSQSYTGHPVTLRVGTEEEKIAGTLHSVTIPVQFSDEVIPDFTVEVLPESSPGQIPVTFTENCEINQANPTTLTTLSWDFGDGNTEPYGATVETHTYTASGAYTVTMEAGDGANTYTVSKTVQVYADDSFPEYGQIEDFELYQTGDLYDHDWAVEGSGEWSREGIEVDGDGAGNSYLTVNNTTPPNLTEVAIIQRSMRAINNRLNVSVRFNEDPEWTNGESLDDNICAAFRTRAADEVIYSAVEIYPNKIALVERWGAFGTDNVERIEFPLEERLAPGAWHNVYIETYGHLRQVWISSDGEPGGTKGTFDWGLATAGPPDAWRSQDKLEERTPPVAPLDTSAITSIHLVYLDDAGNYYPDAVWVDDYGLSARTGDFQVPILDPAVEAQLRESIGLPQGVVYSTDLSVAPLWLDWTYESGQQIASLRGFEYLRTTTEVVLDGHAVTEIFPLTQPPHMSLVSLQDNAIVSLPNPPDHARGFAPEHINWILAQTYDWDKLVWLNLSGNPLNATGALDSAAALQLLEYIDLSRTGLYDLHFGDDAALGNVTEGAALSGLTQLGRLNFLDISCTQVRNLYPIINSLWIGPSDTIIVNSAFFTDDSPQVLELRNSPRAAKVEIDPGPCDGIVYRHRIETAISAPDDAELPTGHGCTLAISPTPGSCEVQDTAYECIIAGTEVTVTPQPGAGYLLHELRVNGSAVELENGSYTFTMDGDKSIVAEFIGESVLTIEFPTAGYTPEVYVDNGFIIGAAGTARTISVATGDTVSLTIPDGALINFDAGILFSHWADTEDPARAFDGSRDPALDLTVTDSTTIQIVGSANYQWLELRDHYTYPGSGQEPVFRGTAVVATDPSDRLLPISFPDINGVSTRYYVLSNPGDPTPVTLTPAAEADFAFEGWEYTGETSGDATSTANPLDLDMTENWTVEPIFAVDPHVLTVNINTAGGGSVAFDPDPINGDETTGQRVEYFNPFREDKTVTLRVIEDLESDHRFDHWVGGAITDPYDPNPSFELTGDTEVTAVFIPSFALSVRNLGGGAVTLTPPARTIDGPVGYEFYPDPTHTQSPAEVVTVAAVEDPLLHLDHWIIDGVAVYSDQPQTVTMSEAHDVVAVFLPGGTHFRFSAHVVGEGTVHLAHSAGHEGQDRDLVEADGRFEEHLPPGATVTATQTSASGWIFDHWQVHEAGGVDVAPDPLPAIDSETSLVAVFRKDVSDPDKVTLTLTQSGEGTVIPAPGVTRFDTDAKVIFTAEPAVGWRFDGWSGGFTSSSPSYTVDKMTSSMAVHATFVPDGTWYSLDVYASEGGTVNPTFGDYPSGATVTVSATPEDGWVFDHWEGDEVDGSEDNTVQVSMDGNKKLNAYFAPLVLISIPPPGTMPGGTFEISPSKPEGYKLGESVTFTPVPDPGWEFDHWEGDLRTSGLKSFGVHSGLMTKSTQSSEGTVTTTLSIAPFQVWAVFKREEYLLTTRAIGDGTIRTSPSKSHFRFGERVKLVALPGADMQFSGWQSSVTQSSAGAIIEFDMPFEDVVVEAVFRRSGRTHKITSLGWMTDDLGSLVIVDANVVTMSPSPGPTYPAGSRVLVTAHNIPGHEFVRWSGDISGSDQTYTIHQLTSDLTIVPVYTPIRELDQLSSITVTTIKGRESSPGLGTPVAAPPPIRVDASDCWDWEDLHPYEEPPPGFCNDGNPRYCSWKLYYTSPMPDVNISVPGAVSIVAAYGEENHGLVVGSDSVNVLAPQVDCGSYPLNRHASLGAYDIEITEGHVGLELFHCLYAEWDPYNQTQVGGCGYEGTCLGWEAGDFLGGSYGLFSSNNLTIQGGGRLIGRENWVLESGTHVLLGSPSLTSTYLNGGLIADYGWEITNYSETPTDAGVDTVYTLEESGTGTTVVVNSSAGGAATGSDVYYPHESATLTATPLPGYSFKYWKRRISGSGEYSPFSTSNPLILPACLIRSQSWQNHFFAEFETRCNSQYSVTIDAIDNGTISLTENRLYYDCDESVEFRAIPDLGYTFVGWTGDLEGTTTNPVTRPTNQNWNVGAVFQPLEDPGFLVALDVDGDGTPEYNPEGVVQLINVLEIALDQFPGAHFKPFAERIGFELGEGVGTEELIQEDAWEITIEQDASPELLFFATSAWTRQYISGTPAYPEFNPGIAPVTTSSFDLRDLDGLGIYAVAYDIPESDIPHDVTATFHLYKNGVYRVSQDVQFQGACVMNMGL